MAIWKDITQSVRLEERLKFEREKLEEIISFDEQLSKIRKSEHLIDFVVRKTRKILEVDKCAVMLVDAETKQLYTKSRDGFALDVPMQCAIAGSIIEEVIREGQPLLVNGLGGEESAKNLKDFAYLGRSFMIAPIRLEQDVIGIIVVADKRSESQESGLFDNVDQKILCAIATEMAVAIENVAFYKELHYLTVTDPLTHTHNYRYFINSLEYEFKRLKRFPGELSLMMMDVDGFKSFNDELGHLEGDVLLREVSLLVHLNLREVDVFCRYGGDEFVVILPGINKVGAAIVAEKIRKCIEKAKFPRQVTLSIGVSQYKSNISRQDLVLRADKALYQAKDQGRNQVCIY